MTVKFKYCAKCEKEKPLSDFRNDKARKDGKYIYCAECHRVYMRDRYHNSPGVRQRHLDQGRAKRAGDPQYSANAKKSADRFYSSVRGRALTLLKGAQRRDPDCTITFEWIEAKLRGGKCEVTGIPFDMAPRYRERTGRRYNPFSPSLDRVDSKKGYHPENVRLVLWQFNVMKNEATDFELYLVAKAFVERYENVINVGQRDNL